MILAKDCSSFVAVKHIMPDTNHDPGNATMLEVIKENIVLFSIKSLMNLLLILVITNERIIWTKIIRLIEIK